MALYDDIRLLALAAVLDEDYDAAVRSIYRWYSKTFATPLHFVPRLQFSDVLTAYFEDRYEHMDAEEREDERRLLTETETEKQARLSAVEEEASSDAAFEAMADAEAKRLESTQIPEQVQVRPVPHPHKPKELPEAMLEGGTPIPADVSVKFVEEGFFEDLMDKLDNQDK